MSNHCPSCGGRGERTTGPEVAFVPGDVCDECEVRWYKCPNGHRWHVTIHWMRKHD